MSFETIPKCNRICSRSGRTLCSGETCFSALVEENGELKRLDFAAEAWPPPPGTVLLGWWRYLIPDATEGRVRLAPNDILFELFDRWVLEPQRRGELYILSLLMLRRRLFRYENADRKNGDSRSEDQTMIVYSPRREMTYSIPVISLTEEEISQIQSELADLLFSGIIPEKKAVPDMPQ